MVVVLGHRIVAMVLPSLCAGCGRRAPGLCSACLAAAPSPSPAAAPDGVLWWVAAFSYEGAAREAIARVKFRNDRAAVPTLVTAMADLVRPAAALHPFDAVTWVPTVVAHRRRRGFDHAQLLAVGVARALGLPARRLLHRVGHEVQTGRSRRERQIYAPVFVATGATPNRVLLVDDVVTTGATVLSAARTLRESGTVAVAVVTAGRTPPPLRVPQGNLDTGR